MSGDTLVFEEKIPDDLYLDNVRVSPISEREGPFAGVARKSRCGQTKGRSRYKVCGFDAEDREHVTRRKSEQEGTSRGSVKRMINENALKRSGGSRVSDKLLNGIRMV